MTRMVTAVIPPAAQRPDLNGRSFAVRSKMSLPLLRSTCLGATVYAVAAVDCNGRVAERAAVRAMGWTAGAALTVWIHAGLILVRADEQGGSVVSPAGYVRLPAAPAVPTFAQYVPIVSAAVGDGSRRAYGSYWNKLVEAWGDRRLDEPTPSQIQQQVEHVRAHAEVRANARGGRSAAENYISALRCLYNHAVADGHVTETENPARKVAKPRRLLSTRRAVPDVRLAEINEVAATTGNDPELDMLILRLHTETACRRGGGLALRPIDLDPQQCLIRLREKGDTVRWQPVSPTLMTHLQRHAHERGAASAGRLLRYRNGRPITHRRYDHLWERIGQHLAWVATQQISTHWLRHTTLTWVEMSFGYAVARGYAGHNDNATDATTTTYVRASLHEIAAALAALTGEDHPLANVEDQDQIISGPRRLTARGPDPP